jgi:hypothetical protein
MATMLAIPQEFSSLEALETEAGTWFAAFLFMSSASQALTFDLFAYI